MVGRHCYFAEILEEEDETEFPINIWLKSLATNNFSNSSSHNESSGIHETISDPFQVKKI